MLILYLYIYIVCLFFFVEAKNLLLHTTSTSLNYSDNPFTQAIISNACEPQKHMLTGAGAGNILLFSVDSTSIKASVHLLSYTILIWAEFLLINKMNKWHQDVTLSSYFEQKKLIKQVSPGFPPGKISKITKPAIHIHQLPGTTPSRPRPCHHFSPVSSSSCQDLHL